MKINFSDDMIIQAKKLNYEQFKKLSPAQIDTIKNKLKNIY